jgi:DNA-binding transcriptional ArsR family regulator
MTRTKVELVREGKYAAEVSIELIEEEGGWSPYLSLDDAKRLEAVRLALREGDIVEASKYGRVFELTPLSV